MLAIYSSSFRMFLNDSSNNWRFRRICYNILSKIASKGATISPALAKSKLKNSRRLSEGHLTGRLFFMRHIQNWDNQACNGYDYHKLFVCTHKGEGHSPRWQAAIGERKIAFGSEQVQEARHTCRVANLPDILFGIKSGITTFSSRRVPALVACPEPFLAWAAPAPNMPLWS